MGVLATCPIRAILLFKSGNCSAEISFYPINLYADAADSTDFADNPFLERAFDD